MFAIAFLIGLYANLILILGLMGLYYQPILAIFTACYLFMAVLAWPLYDEEINLRRIKEDILGHIKIHRIWVLIIIASIGVMIIGALAPETAFDSLWYHLTLPKLYLNEHGIRFVSGGLLHYSGMPKLAELLYVPALSFHSEILAKLIHMSFGLLTGIVVYILGKRYTDRRFGIIALVIFLGNIVVLWEATTAFVDLARAFFEIMAFWGLIEFIQKDKKKWLIESALLMGLAIETKLIGVTTLVVYCLVILFFYKKVPIAFRIKSMVMYAFFAMLIPLPWLIFAYIHTGNPLYPLFSPYLVDLGKATLQFPMVVLSPFKVFISSPDPLSPVYLLLAPLFFMIRKNLSQNEKLLFITIAMALVAWMVTPQTGGGRFMVPYLPLFSIASSVILYRTQQFKSVALYSLIAIIAVSGISLIYRGVASTKYIPVLFGLESRQEFLSKNLDFNFGDYYDTDGMIKELVKPGSTVLLYGFHNLYYMDVSHIDSTWVKVGDKFDFIATQNTALPARFKYWVPVYKNGSTGVTLYSANQTWIY